MTAGSPDPIPKSSSNPFAPFFWAVYLGCSWTWVIGMFLPVLLVRDYGLWGWVAFAVPNVVGAAAMGWVMRDAAASERFVERHRGACIAFSVVTIAYHVFFAAWMIERLRGWGWVALIAFAVAAIIPATNVARWGLACLALLASLSAWKLLGDQQSALMLPTLQARDGTPATSALYLVPIFVVGFSLCPYLDLTFHRARRSTSVGSGRFAFGFGFGVVFCAMIFFTLLYARWLAPAVDGSDLAQVSTMFLCFHLIAQGAFTVGAHAQELAAAGFAKGSAAWAAAFFIFVALGLGMWAKTPRVIAGHDAGEVIYWCLLGFYGTVFPAYLLMRGSRNLLLLAVTVAAAMPLLWMGFIERRPIFLVGGAVVVLASRAFAGRRADAASERSEDADLVSRI